MKQLVLRYVLPALFLTPILTSTIGCVDKCNDQYCLNGGDCLDGTCICSNGYTGVHCETAPASAGYNCTTGGDCSYVSSNAQFATLAACEDFCSVLEDGFVCVDGDCYSVPTGAQFATLTECQNSSGCYEPQGAGYICDNNDNCQAVLNNPEYGTLSECEASCGSSGGYNCVNGVCVAVSSGGQYQYSAECNQLCN